MLEVDRDKSELFFLHVLKSAKKFKQKQVHRGELVEALSDLRSLKVNKAFETKLDKLEASIEALINHEKRILKAQNKEQLFNAELKTKINALDEKLAWYKAQTEQRQDKVKKIEKKLETKMKERDRIAELKGELEGLETVYDNLREQHQESPALLVKIEKKIEELKKRLTSPSP